MSDTPTNYKGQPLNKAQLAFRELYRRRPPSECESKLAAKSAECQRLREALELVRKRAPRMAKEVEDKIRAVLQETRP